MMRSWLADKNPWLVLVPELALYRQAVAETDPFAFLPLCTEVYILNQEGTATYVRSGSQEGWIFHAATYLEPKRTLPPLTHVVVRDAPCYRNPDGTGLAFMLPKDSRFAAGREQISDTGIFLLIQPLLQGQGWIPQAYASPIRR